MKQQTTRRNTQQRRVIVDELRKHPTHPTAAELYEATRRRLPRISLGTVYRNLDVLGRMGVVRKIEVGGGEARFDLNVTPHHHVRCVHCSNVADVRDSPVALSTDGIEEIAGHEIVGYRLEFTGICSECRRQTEGSEGP